MRSAIIRFMKITMLPVLLLLLAGCAALSPPSAFYLLTPRIEAGGQKITAPLLGVGPVNLPAYLDRNQLLRRTGTNAVQVEEFHRWAGELGQNTTNVLAENLARLLGSDGVVAYPWNSTLRLPYQVSVDVRRFEAGPANQVVLDAQWQLLDRENNQLLTLKTERIVVDMADQSYQEQVRAQSEALAILARNIAAAIPGR